MVHVVLINYHMYAGKLHPSKLDSKSLSIVDNKNLSVGGQNAQCPKHRLVFYFLLTYEYCDGSYGEQSGTADAHACA